MHPSKIERSSIYPLLGYSLPVYSLPVYHLPVYPLAVFHLPAYHLIFHTHLAVFQPLPLADRHLNTDLIGADLT